MFSTEHDETEASEAPFDNVADANDLNLDYGRLYSSAEINEIFAAWSADQSNGDKANALWTAVLQNSVRLAGKSFTKRPTLWQRQDIAADVIDKLFRRLPGPQLDPTLKPFDITQTHAFNAYLMRMLHTTSIDYLRRNDSENSMLSLTEADDEDADDFGQGRGLLNRLPDNSVMRPDEWLISRELPPPPPMTNGPFEAPLKRGRGRPKLTGPEAYLSRHYRAKLSVAKNKLSERVD